MARLAPRVAPARRLALALTALLLLTAGAAGPGVAQDREQSTQLVSRALDGGLPNAASEHGVISADRRYARLIAYESDASNLVAGDTNGFRDVFALRRAGSFGNKGTPWKLPSSALLVSRGRKGEPANGPSFAPAVDGGHGKLAACVAFLSSASNLVAGDTNGKVDAFLATKPGSAVRRVSLKGKKQLKVDATHVTVSTDCTKVAFVAGGALRVWHKGRTRRLDAPGNEADPAFAVGRTNDVVFGASGGVYLSIDARSKPKLVAAGGTDPVYNSVSRQVIAYEKTVGSLTQVYARNLGRKERLVSHSGGRAGNGSSRDPVIGNSGYYVTFESDASDLPTNAGGAREDGNGAPDSYLYTEVRDLSLIQSVAEKGVALPLGGRAPSTSYGANYLLFQTPGPIGTTDPAAPPQVYMRYLGGE